MIEYRTDRKTSASRIASADLQIRKENHTMAKKIEKATKAIGSKLAKLAVSATAKTSAKTTQKPTTQTKQAEKPVRKHAVTMIGGGSMKAGGYAGSKLLVFLLTHSGVYHNPEALGKQFGDGFKPSFIDSRLAKIQRLGVLGSGTGPNKRQSTIPYWLDYRADGFVRLLFASGKQAGSRKLPADLKPPKSAMVNPE